MSKPRKRLRVWLHPDGVKRDYQSVLLNLVDSMGETALEEFSKDAELILSRFALNRSDDDSSFDPSSVEGVTLSDSFAGLVLRVSDRIRNKVVSAQNAAAGRVRGFARAVSNFNAKQFGLMLDSISRAYGSQAIQALLVNKAAADSYKAGQGAQAFQPGPVARAPGSGGFKPPAPPASSGVRGILGGGGALPPTVPPSLTPALGGNARGALGVDVFRSEPWLADELAAFEAENLALIRSIPETYLMQLQSKVIAAVRAGTTTKDLIKTVQESLGVPKNRARLIARDQVGKLNGQLTQIRQQSVGIEEYNWRGVMDSRERPTHVAREGKTYKWADGPPDGLNPGLEIQCRCYGEPVIPLFSQFEENA